MAQNCEVDVIVGGVRCRVTAPEGKVPNFLKRSQPEGHSPNFHSVPGGVMCVKEESFSAIEGTNPTMRARGYEDLVNGVRHSKGGIRKDQF